MPFLLPWPRLFGVLWGKEEVVSRRVQDAVGLLSITTRI
jgi:hypothetical protein